MKVYYVSIKCHQGNHVMKLTVELDYGFCTYFPSSKQAWFLGNQFLQNCPPAASFEICTVWIDPKYACALLNQ